MIFKKAAQFLVVAISLLGVLSLLLGGCAPFGTPNDQSGNGKPVRGGTWIDALASDPDSLIANGTVQTSSELVDQALYAPPFVGSYNGTIQLGIASEMPTVQNGDISQDLKTWTIKLLPHLQWSDGQPLNADDADFTWRLWTNPMFVAGSTSGYNLIASADVSSDKLSITYHLTQPYAPFLSLWTDGLLAYLPKHHFAGMSPDAILRSKDNLNPQVVSGPFMMSESMPGDHYTVVRNPHYYRTSRGLPYLDKIVFTAGGDQNTILKNLQTDSITSSWSLDLNKLSTYKKLSNYHLAVNPNTSNFEIMIFNLNNPILGENLDVRKAIAMAIDYQALIKTVQLGQAVPLCTDHGQALHPGYQPNMPCPKFDPAAANALLEQDGWIMGSDKVRSKQGQRLEFTYSTSTEESWALQDEALIRSNLKDIGIKLDVQNYPAITFYTPFLSGGKHDIAEFEDSYTYDPNDSSLLACDQRPPDGENWNFYCDPQMDTLLKKELSTADPAVRQQAFNQIHDIELTQFPFIVLYGPLDLGIAKARAHNYAPGPMGATETINVWEWWCSDGQC
ncbi:MAG: peptide ABC transporter substrate-binding protein [Chloroflexi bacterium]|nr:peptide ABC transporter substrate-binding protein [Chloroflexota bacterium]